jgi:ribosomal protein L29
MGGAPHSPGKIRAIRRNIARMLTIMREEEIAKARAPAPKETTKPEEGA